MAKSASACEDCKHYDDTARDPVTPPLCVHPGQGPIRARVGRRHGQACGRLGELFEAREFSKDELLKPKLGGKARENKA